MDVDACLHFQTSMAPVIKSMAEAYGCSSVQAQSRPAWLMLLAEVAVARLLL